jgi:hypothetical protein
MISLVNALKAGGPNSASVQQVLQEINAQFPAQADVAKSIVDGWPTSPATPPEAVSLTSGFSFTSWKFLAPVLAALGIGSGAGASIDTKALMDSLKTIPLPVINNRWELLGVVAVVGAIVGFAYSFYRNNWTIILPKFSKNQDQFKVASWGFLRNVLMAAIVSAGTTWLAFSSTSSSDGNLLTWTVLMSTAAAGLVGSRMASGEVEKNVLWEALATAAERPPASGLGKLVDDAKTPLDAAAIATGQSVPGVKPPKEMNLVRRTADIEADLLRLFDRPTLKDWLTKRGVPLGQDGAGVPVGTLEEVLSLRSALKTAIKDLEIVPVAGMSSDAFLSEVEKRGIDALSFKELLGNVQRQAIAVRDTLAKLPVGWSLTPDRA